MTASVAFTAPPPRHLFVEHERILAGVERGATATLTEDARQLVRLATALGWPELAARFRLTLAWLELDAGRPSHAARELTRAAPALTDADAAKARCLRGLHLHATGRHAWAHTELTAASAALRGPADRHWLGNVLVARGSAAGYLLRLREADADYAAAADLFDELHLPVRAAACVHNRGFVATLSGDIPLALRHFSDAIDLGLPVARHPEALVDRANALLAAGLTGEARALLHTAVDLLTAAGRGRKLAEALLAAARCAWQAGSAPLTAEAAGRAVTAFGPDRPGWRAAAEALQLAATVTVGTLSQVDRVARRADRHGWPLAAAELRLAAARVALAAPASVSPGAATAGAAKTCGGADLNAVRAVRATVGAAEGGVVGVESAALEVDGADIEAAWAAADVAAGGVAGVDLVGMGGRWLAEVAELRGRGLVGVRLRGWVARALAAEARGDRAGVLAACRAGLGVVWRYSSVLGAWELQAGTSALAVELAELGLAAAVAGGRAQAVLRWADRCRAASLRRAVVVPSDDPEVAQRLARLRAAAGGVRPRQRQVAALEERVRLADWARPGQRRTAADSGRSYPPPAATELALSSGSRGAVDCVESAQTGRSLGGEWGFAEVVRELGAATLVCFYVHDGCYSAVVVNGGRVRRCGVGAVAGIDRVVRAWRLALRVGARGAEAARKCAAELDSRLIGALKIGDGPIVVVPTESLHGVVWAGLGSCSGRAVTVAPSVGCWLGARRRDRPTNGGAVWIAGPGLGHADTEVRSLRRRHRGRLLASAKSAVGAVLAAMDGTDLVHIAAHGEFRDDAPLFSRLNLADGPLYGYDIARLGVAPRRIVLSACDAGLAAVRPGDEVIGLAAALLRAGSATVVASVLPVPDEAVVGLMADLHRHLDTGRTPADALAAAQQEHGHLGFVCLGAG